LLPAEAGAALAPILQAFGAAGMAERTARRTAKFWGWNKKKCRRETRCLERFVWAGIASLVSLPWIV
jgi:hypothetical protein